MTATPGLITRIALFSALVYVLSLGTSYLPNINPAFFVAFSAGFLWGTFPGALAGGVGMWLWTSFNPHGPATLPIMIAQVMGMAACGMMGGLFGPALRSSTQWRRTLLILLAAIACTTVFYLPVTLADAWVYQPFWVRVVQGIAWTAVSLAANLIIFPLLFGVLRYLYDREHRVLCSN